MYQRLRNLREDRDLNQTEVAAVLHVSQTTYSRYESGTLDIPSASLIALARFYGTSVDYLLGLTDEPAPYRKYAIFYPIRCENAADGVYYLNYEFHCGRTYP